MLHRVAVSNLLLLFLAAGSFAQQPNIVLIYYDDAAYPQFGFSAEHFGLDTQFETPNIDALAQQSTIISNGYCTYPVCSPSRAGLLTGLHQSRYGFEYLPSNGEHSDGLTGEQRIIPSYLKDFGYATGAIGKWHVGVHDGVNRPQDLGFDEFYGFLSGGRDYWRYGGNTTNVFAMRRGDAPIENIWATEGDASRYDPVKGRYLTDALGEEAADFVTRQAQAQTPFFLYMPLLSPHVPLQAKQADLEHFAHIEDTKERTLAAMMYAADRAIGDVLNALEANGVDQNTMIVLANDNGGPAPYKNNPFRGGKGQLLEGGIRTPFLIKAPGVAPGVYDKPISTLDMLPTFLSLAGGDPSAIETDGVDVLPYLKGERTGDPHEILYWRSAGNRFAVRRGDWKLTRPEGGGGAVRLYNLANDMGERTNLASQQPALVQELLRELTFWEAEMAKPRWGSFGAPTMNRFDHFVFHHEGSPAAVWSEANRWRQVSGQSATLKQEDAYANAVLEFQTSDSDYVATNDMKRSTLESFMLNEIQLTGEYDRAIDHQGTINGNELLFVKNLEGQPPRILLDATATPSAGDFSFYLENRIRLLDELEIGGDGTQPLEIRGPIIDYYEPRGVTKIGASRVRLSGSNTYSGDTTVEAGELSISQPFLTDTADVRLFSGATLELDFSGIDTVSALYINGSPQNVGAWGAIGNAAADFHSEYIIGAGLLYVSSIGQPGDFNGDGAVNAADYIVWRKGLGSTYHQNTYSDWLENFGESEPGLPGDFNRDGSVDTADYVVWRKGLGTLYDQSDYGDWLENFGRSSAGLPGDFNGDGSVDTADYVVWRKGLGTFFDQSDYANWLANFGAKTGDGAFRQLAAPEPASAVLFSWFIVWITVSSRRRHSKPSMDMPAT